MSTEKSYAQILKASSVMGGAAGVNLLLGMLRVKFAAVLIGTAGVGLISSFSALQGLVSTLAGLGLHSSAVREISAAVGKGDQQNIGKAVLTLHRLCWMTGIVGMAAMMLMSPLLSQITFGHRGYTLEIAALGLVILFGNLSGGQMALIQAMRRIGDIARINIIGAAIGTATAVGFYATLGLRGIVPTLITISAIQLLLSWQFAKTVQLPKVTLTARETVYQARSFLSLGIVFTWTALMSTGSHYVSVALVTRQHGEAGLGIYSAAFGLSAIFINFVLQAMGADYYPRLSAESENNENLNRLANEQIQIGVLLATPGLIATIAYAEIGMKLFYTSEFMDAVELLKVLIFGCLGRLVGWPTGFIILAKKKDFWFLFTQTFYAIINIALMYIALQQYGLIGTAIAFVAQVAIGIIINRIVIGHLTSFKWDKETIKNVAMSVSSLTFCYLISRLESTIAITLGTALLTISLAFSAQRLANKLGPKHPLSEKIISLKRRFNCQ